MDNCISSSFFFSDYKTLRDHFLNDHYLCEEGDCADAQFTNAFRSDIDLKSHQAHEHSKAQTRQQARQERTINIDINLVPRPNSRPQRGKNACLVHVSLFILLSVFCNNVYTRCFLVLSGLYLLQKLLISRWLTVYIT